MKIKKYSNRLFAFLYNHSEFVLTGASSAFIVCLALSIIWYHHEDSSFLYYSTVHHELHNPLGLFGAYTAALLLYLFGGYGALLFLMLVSLFIFLFLFSAHVMREWDRILAATFGLVAGAGWCALYQIDMMPTIPPGGWLGINMAALCTYWFDPLGAQLLIHIVLLSAVIILIRFPLLFFLQLVKQCGLFARRIAYLMRPLGLFLYAVTVLSGRILRKLLSGIVRLVTPAYYEDELDGDIREHTIIVASRHELERDGFSLHNVPELASHNDTISAQQPIALQKDKKIMVQDDAKISEVGDTLDRSEKKEYSKKEQPYKLPEKNIFIGIVEEQNDPRVQHELEERARILEEKLKRFGVSGKVVAIKQGPVVTLFEYQPEIDSKISKIIALEDDLALALQALSIRIIAPIPGRSVVGFEVANRRRKNVLFSTLIKSEQFEQYNGLLPLILGEDTSGAPVFIDLAHMPHLLIAGSTGSGKSVALNTMLMSLLCTKKPEELTLILIDPKRLEFAPYADIAHLAFPIVTQAKRAILVLRWVVKQMEQRYELMAQYGARNIFDYNQIVDSTVTKLSEQTETRLPLPFIVVVIDELSDLMMLAGKEAEELITRITQMARAAGIHLIVATQRPSVDVITGLIKVNFPSRISFRVTSKIDSRTILDCQGADKLLGRGDMLFLNSSSSLLKRVHGAYVSDEEIDLAVSHIKSERAVVYEDLEEIVIEKGDLCDADDQLYQEILTFLDTIDELSISLLQRRFRIGYNRSARIIDTLESEGLILPAEGSKMRKVVR